MNADATSLSNLHDIVLPPPVSWWPLAWGWYLVAALLLAGLAWSLIRWQRRRRANRYRELALSELDALSAAIGDPAGRRSADPAGRRSALSALPVLLKRVALAAWPRRQVAGLSGEAWSRFLDESGADGALGKVHGPRLDRLAYGPEPDASLSETEAKGLTEAIRAWIRGHRAPNHGGS